MSSPRSSFARLILGATTLSLACVGLAIPISEARDGRSRTKSFGIDELPTPSRQERESLIAEFPPLRPIHADALSRPGASAQAQALPMLPRSVRAGLAAKKEQAVPTLAVKPETAPVAVAAPAPETKADDRQQASGFDFDGALRLNPATLGAVATASANAPGETSANAATATKEEGPAAEAASVVAALNRPATQPEAFAPRVDPAEAASIGLEAKPRFAMVEGWAVGEDALAPASSTELATLILLKTSGAPTLETAGPVAPDASTTTLAASGPSATAQPDHAAAPAHASRSIFAETRTPRASTRPQLSGLAGEIVQVSNSIPPVQFELGKPRQQDEAGGVPSVMRPAQVSGGFQWRMPESVTKPKEVVEGEKTAEAAPQESEESLAARKAEQERKNQMWDRIAKAQAASRAKALAEAQKDPDAENQLPLFRVIKKMMHPEARNDEERAYQALLKEGVKGPIRVRLAERATLWLPSGYVFIDAEKARDLMDGEAGVMDEANQGIVLPDTRTPTWMGYVDLLDEGFVKEDDAKAMDAPSLLAAFTASVAAQNMERAHYGVAPLTVDRWVQPPSYLAAKHNVNACVSAIDASAVEPGERLVNCLSFALGRQGAIKILVAGEQSNVAAFEQEAADLAGHVTYDQGAGYRDIVATQDRAARYGSAELVGGAVGLKSIVAVAAAAGAGKNQELFLTRILSYWEYILTAALIVVVGVRWLQANRLENEGEAEEDYRAKPRTSLWKLAISLAGAALRHIFERDAPETPTVDAKAAAAPAEAVDAAKPATEKKSLLATMRQKASNLPLPMLRKAAKAEAPKVGAPEAAPETADPKLAAPMRVGPLAAATAGLREKFSALPFLRKTAPDADAPATKARPGEAAKAEAPKAGAPGADSVASATSKLGKLASVMRKKAEEPPPIVGVGQARVKRDAAPQAAASPPAKAAPVTAPEKPSAPSSVVADVFDFVEPGDAQAVSIAREALQQAHG